MGRENERFLDSKEWKGSRKTNRTDFISVPTFLASRDWLLTLANHDCQQKKLLNYTHFKEGGAIGSREKLGIIL